MGTSPKEIPPTERQSWFDFLIEGQSWIAFLLLGIFLISVRLYNAHLRSQQRALLRSTVMASIGVPSGSTAEGGTITTTKAAPGGGGRVVNPGAGKGRRKGKKEE